MPTDRRSAILDKALDYLLDHGVADLSLRPLAKASGTSARLLIYHFGSRDGLLSAVMDEVRDRMQRDFVSIATGAAKSHASPLDAFWAYATKADSRRYLRLLFEVQVLALHRPKEFEKYLARTSASWLSLVEGAIGKGKNSAALATLCVAVIDGLLLELLSTGDKRRTTDALSLFQRLLDQSKSRRAH